MSTDTKFSFGWLPLPFFIYSVVCLSSLLISALISLFVPYCENSLHASMSQSYELFSAWLSLFFMLPVVMGYISNKYIGNNMAVMWGLIFLVIGCFLLVADHVKSFYAGICLFATGAGLYSTNIYTIVGRRFSGTGRLRAKAFLSIYIVMNLGAFIGGFASGFVVNRFGYQYAFGMLLLPAVAAISAFFPVLYSQASKGGTTRKSHLTGASIIMIITVLAVFLISYKQYIHVISIALFVGCLGFLCVQTVRSNSNFEKSNTVLFLLFSIFLIGYWGVYMLYPSIVEMYVEHSVQIKIYGEQLHPATVASLSPLFICILGGVFMRYRDNVDNIQKIRRKIVVAFCLIGASFFMLWLSNFLASGSLALFATIVFAYLLFAASEVLVGPSALSMVGLLVMAELETTMLGFMSLMKSLSGVITAGLLSLSEIDLIKAGHVFLVYAAIPVLLGVVFYVLHYSAYLRYDKA